MNDCVKLQYTAWLRDGSVVARSAPNAAPEAQCMRRLSPDVAEAVRRMVTGERVRLWVPARPNAKGAATPHSVALTYDLLLVEIVRAPEVPRDLKSPPAAAQKFPSGLALLLLGAKTGAARPTATSRVSLRLAGWTATGKLFESTAMGGRPALYALRELVPGLRAGVQQLAVGERARLWIPAALAYGATPRRGQPAGDLIYDVELVAVDTGN